MQHFVEQLYHQLTHDAHRKVLYLNGTYISYQKFAQRVFGIAEHQKSLKDKHPVAVMFTNDLDCYACIAASWISGKGYIALHPDDPNSVHQEIVSQLSIQSIYGVSQSFEIPNEEINYYHLNDIADADSSAKQLNDHNIAYVIYTSGSTAKPKQIRVTHKNVNALVQAFKSCDIKLSADDQVLHVSDFTFDMSVLTFLLPLLYGACIYPIKKEGIVYLEFAEMLQEHNISYTAIVPSTLRFLKPYLSDLNVPSLKTCLVCGEEFPIELAQTWQKCAPNAEIFNIYGPSEATVFVLYHKFRDDHSEEQFQGILSLGKPLDKVDLVVLNKSNQTTGNELGELCISGEQVIESIDESIVMQDSDDGPKVSYYPTGDLVRKGEDDLYFFYGRKDFMVQVKGHRVQPLEIEQKIREHFPTLECCIVSGEDNFENTSLYLFVVAKVDEAQKLWDVLPQMLKHYEIPEQYFVLEKMPLNKNYKTDRKKLQSLING